MFQKKNSDDESDLESSMEVDTSLTRREPTSRRAASKKVNYAALLKDDDDSEEEEDGGFANPKFDSDDEDELLDNTGINEAAAAQQQMNSTNDMFDSLKSEEESPVKKPVVKRKLGAKPEVVKAPTKRSKKQLTDSDDDSPVKVI